MTNLSDVTFVMHTHTVAIPQSYDAEYTRDLEKNGWLFWLNYSIVKDGETIWNIYDIGKTIDNETFPDEFKFAFNMCGDVYWEPCNPHVKAAYTEIVLTFDDYYKFLSFAVDRCRASQQ